MVVTNVAESRDVLLSYSAFVKQIYKLYFNLVYSERMCDFFVSFWTPSLD